MAHGYSTSTAIAIKNANGKLIGVRFGKYCLAKNIAVAEVARRMKVSRMCVYKWFKGDTPPSKVYAEAMRNILKKETN